MESWRRIDSWDGAPGFQMALDEALLRHGPEAPTLRFYTWRPAALSLGYFQRFADVPAASEADCVVRRLTGGGAIHHTAELTYSLTARAEHALFRGPVADSYARLHGALARALATLDVEATLRGEAELTSERAGTGMCFHASTPLDLVWDAAKGVGSAQRRTGGRVLHHGSIKLGASELEPGVATLSTTPQELAERVTAALEATFEARVEFGAPTEEELLHAYRREGAFGSREFVRRR